jgi:hypothetical protein
MHSRFHGARRCCQQIERSGQKTYDILKRCTLPKMYCVVPMRVGSIDSLYFVSAQHASVHVMAQGQLWLSSAMNAGTQTNWRKPRARGLST